MFPRESIYCTLDFFVLSPMNTSNSHYVNDVPSVLRFFVCNFKHHTIICIKRFDQSNQNVNRNTFYIQQKGSKTILSFSMTNPQKNLERTRKSSASKEKGEKIDRRTNDKICNVHNERFKWRFPSALVCCVSKLLS